MVPRTTVRRTTARRTTAMVLVSATAAMLAACGVPIDRNDRPLTSEQFKGILTVPTTIGPVQRANPGIHPFWIVGARIISSPTAADVTDVGSAVKVLLKGPGRGDEVPGARSAVSVPGLLLGATAARGTATVEVGSLFGALDDITQTQAAAQVVFTLTQVPGVGLVSFTSAGKPIAVRVVDGTRADGPVSRDDFSSLVDD